MPLHHLFLLQQSVGFGSGAPLGTGLEWMTLAALLIPALILVVLVYVGAEETV
jgi:hypothetical protein